MSIKEIVRVAAVQYNQNEVDSIVTFENRVRYFVEVAADYKSDFVVFPEFLTLQILSKEKSKLSAKDSLQVLSDYSVHYKKFMAKLAVENSINIIGGSHLSYVNNEKVENIAPVFLRNGELIEQAKIHPTPSEVATWQVKGGDKLRVIETDCGKIGVLICYDVEFPELARILVDEGVIMIFVPFCTDERQGYLRVRYCAQARAVENQLYLVLSGNCGNLPKVTNMDIQYSQSCILTPCDFPFARDGIAAEASVNSEGIIFADLMPNLLLNARKNGTVRNLNDRRFDLYSTKWLK